MGRGASGGPSVHQIREQDMSNAQTNPAAQPIDNDPLQMISARSRRR